MKLYICYNTLKKIPIKTIQVQFYELRSSLRKKENDYFRIPGIFQGTWKNNYKEWFHANKDRYQQEVKTPFHRLVEKTLSILKEIDPEIPDDPKDIIMRINKDIRFSKDKAPYNTLLKANFTPGGRKSGNPGFYLGISAEAIHLGGGLYQVSTAALKNIRKFMVENSGRLIQLQSDISFQEKFGSIKGEKMKRIGIDFMAHSNEIPLLLQKQFFYMKQLEVDAYVDVDPLPVFKAYFQAVAPWHHFFKEAVR